MKVYELNEGQKVRFKGDGTVYTVLSVNHFDVLLRAGNNPPYRMAVVSLKSNIFDFEIDEAQP